MSADVEQELNRIKSEVAQRPTPPEIVRENPILRTKVWGKMNVHNDNYMGAVCGDTGSGKSWAALRIAEAVDPDFSIEQVAFSVEEFLRLVIDDSYGRGSMIVFEEASVEAAAYDWQSKGNKVFRQVLDTWRNQNRGLLITLPAFGQLDKGARGRMSALIQMHEKKESEGYTVAKYKWCDQDSDTGKIYKKYPRLGGKVFKKLKIRKPSKGLRDAYEERKSNYTNNLNRELLEELLEATADDDDEDENDPHTVAHQIIDNGDIDGYISDNNGVEYLDRDLIELDYGIGARRSKKVKKLIVRECDLDVQ